MSGVDTIYVWDPEHVGKPFGHHICENLCLKGTCVVVESPHWAPSVHIFAPLGVPLRWVCALPPGEVLDPLVNSRFLACAMRPCWELCFWGRLRVHWGRGDVTSVIVGFYPWSQNVVHLSDKEPPLGNWCAVYLPPGNLAICENGPPPLERPPEPENRFGCGKCASANIFLA